MANRMNFDDNIFSDVSMPNSFPFGGTVEAGGTVAADVHPGFGGMTAADEGATVPLDEQNEVGGTEVIGEFEVDGKTVAPTVGWLICTKGSMKGRDFRLHNGWNYIGADEKMDIRIRDPKVSGYMARVSYDNRGKMFYIAPSDQSTNLTYCNDEPLLSPKALKIYDVIAMGDTDMIFVPLCGEHFNWEE